MKSIVLIIYWLAVLHRYIFIIDLNDRSDSVERKCVYITKRFLMYEKCGKVDESSKNSIEIVIYNEFVKMFILIDNLLTRI